ncbi:MAG TPA: hypothetical protein DCZ97_09835 [Syntrophus sp. (in: bacteria)]|nr:MAG: hypothetical protein A2091_08380 [Desulfuromonadales bacterium GWD2_61_12]HBB17267.1 hypothetical protein [Syntrophus sp. (in: bacteria)]
MSGLPQHYQQRAEAFIKTVVCFDDKAEYRKPRSAKTATKGGDGFVTPPPAVMKAEVATLEDDAPTGDELDARALTESFAQKGILCSVIIPHATAEEVTTQITTLTKSADITILDWKLGGVTPRDAIVRIIEDDNASGGKLRLLVIYSDGVAKDVMTELAGVLRDHGFSFNESTLELTGKHARIVFFQKPNPSTPPTNVVPYEALPDHAVKEFTKLTSGLLPAAALAAITEIREQTHHLLATFPATLDGAFLAHRCLIPDPNDAEQFLLDIFEGEIGSLLRHNGVGNSVNAERCMDWVESLTSQPKEKIDKIKVFLSDYNDDKKEEFRNFFSAKKLKEYEISQRIMELMYGDIVANVDAGKIGLSLLATLDACKRSKMKTLPRLQLGSLIKNKIDGNVKYLMCIQPLCDSVRIDHESGSSFPFIVLKIVDVGNVNSSIDVCIFDEESVVWLAAKTKPSNLETKIFKGKSNKEKFVEAVKEESDYFFCASSGEKYEWVGELKLGKAQRIASQLAARIHTLGIDEFEWMRSRQAEQKQN